MVNILHIKSFSGLGSVWEITKKHTTIKSIFDDLIPKTQNMTFWRLTFMHLHDIFAWYSGIGRVLWFHHELGRLGYGMAKAMSLSVA